MTTYNQTTVAKQTTASAPAGATTTSATKPTYYQQKQLTSEVGYEPQFTSQVALEIMRYRRQYKSQGIANFAKEWLEPTLKSIQESLTERGYIVAYKVCGDDKDGYRNYCFDVSTKEQTNNVLYVAHYDTVDRDATDSVMVYDEKTKKYKSVTVNVETQQLYKDIVVENGVAKLDDTVPLAEKASCLGADDGAGLAVMLDLMNRGVLGGYCFVTGEECGGIGAGIVTDTYPNFLKQYKYAVEIDRRGEDEIIWTQGVGECASLTFTQWLCDQLGMLHIPSDLGSYTDVADFAEIIPECVNIAAGYSGAHSANEELSLVYLDKLADKLASVVWDNAPVERSAGDYGEDWTNVKYGVGSTTYYYRGCNSGNANSSKDDDLLTYSELCDVASMGVDDPDFIVYLLSSLSITKEDLDEICEGYFGMDWNTTFAEYNASFEQMN